MPATNRSRKGEKPPGPAGGRLFLGNKLVRRWPGDAVIGNTGRPVPGDVPIDQRALGARHGRCPGHSNGLGSGRPVRSVRVCRSFCERHCVRWRLSIRLCSGCQARDFFARWVSEDHGGPRRRPRRDPTKRRWRLFRRNIPARTAAYGQSGLQSPVAARPPSIGRMAVSSVSISVRNKNDKACLCRAMECQAGAGSGPRNRALRVPAAFPCQRCAAPGIAVSNQQLVLAARYQQPTL